MFSFPTALWFLPKQRRFCGWQLIQLSNVQTNEQLRAVCRVNALQTALVFFFPFSEKYIFLLEQLYIYSSRSIELSWLMF